ncbi:MAG: hypothetical protein WDM96_18395 [Lacunisphaera sp.]
MREIRRARQQQREEDQRTVRGWRQLLAQPGETMGEETRRQPHDAVAGEELERDGEADKRHAERQAEFCSGDGVHHADGKPEQRQREERQQHQRRVELVRVVVEAGEVQLVVERDERRHEQESRAEQDEAARGEAGGEASQGHFHGLWTGPFRPGCGAGNY